MRLRRLHITGFGRLHEYEIVFDAGVTVLLGANEAGKSTALHCLAQVLMGKPSQRSLFPDYTPWDGGPAAAALDMEHGGAQYRLTRRFDENGTRAVALHVVHDDGSERLVTREAGAVRRWVAEAFGTADDRIFYRVFCLTQSDLSPLDNFAGLREQLERAASGTDVAVASAIQQLDARLGLLRRGVNQPALAQNWGPIKRADMALGEWEARLHDAKRQQRRLAELRHQQERLQHDTEMSSARIAEIEGVLAVDQQQREMRIRLAELRDSWERDARQQIRINQLLAEGAQTKASLELLPAVFHDPESVHTRLLPFEQVREGGAKLGWIVLALGMALGVVLGLTISWAVGIPLAVVAALTGIWMMWRVAGRRAERAALCRALGVATLAEARERLASAEALRQQSVAAERAVAAVTGAEDEDAARGAQAVEMLALEQRLSRMPGTPLTVEEAYRLTHELTTTRQALAEDQAGEKASWRELAVLEESERDLIDVEDGVAYWREEATRAAEEEQTLQLARELLIEAGERAHGAMAHPLAARMAPLFAEMTGGRYPQVRVTGNADLFELFPLDASGMPVPVAQLSRGTREQFVLAARLALGLVISGADGSPVYLLDDPLLHFDAARRAEALRMLTDFSAHAQLIIATHDERILDDLPGATVQRFDALVASS
ncbi:MAG TPA: AAA family ATPase [Armatimonadota bacterium]|jgi:uncharacterized protein YhaN